MVYLQQFFQPLQTYAKSLTPNMKHVHQFFQPLQTFANSLTTRTQHLALFTLVLSFAIVLLSIYYYWITKKDQKSHLHVKLTKVLRTQSVIDAFQRSEQEPAAPTETTETTATTATTTITDDLLRQEIDALSLAKLRQQAYEWGKQIDQDNTTSLSFRQSMWRTLKLKSIEHTHNKTHIKEKVASSGCMDCLASRCVQLWCNLLPYTSTLIIRWCCCLVFMMPVVVLVLFWTWRHVDDNGMYLKSIIHVTDTYLSDTLGLRLETNLTTLFATTPTAERIGQTLHNKGR